MKNNLELITNLNTEIDYLEAIYKTYNSQAELEEKEELEETVYNLSLYPITPFNHEPLKAFKSPFLYPSSFFKQAIAEDINNELEHHLNIEIENHEAIAILLFIINNKVTQRQSLINKIEVQYVDIQSLLQAI